MATNLLHAWTILYVDVHLSLKARHIDSDGVANFLRKIGLPQYADNIKEFDIDGKLLLEADSELLIELGIEDPQHQKRITRLFSQELLGTKAKYSNDHLIQFLEQNEQFREYIPVLKKYGIDGDMILHADENLKSKLKETRINLDILKIRYKKYVSSSWTNICMPFYGDLYLCTSYTYSIEPCMHVVLLYLLDYIFLYLNPRHTSVGL